MMASGSAVQVKGLGSVLCSRTKRLMAAWRSTTEWKTPRWSLRLESWAKKPSTALSQEQEVGVKWKVQRGCRSSQGRKIGRASCRERGWQCVVLGGRGNVKTK